MGTNRRKAEVKKMKLDYYRCKICQYSMTAPYGQINMAFLLKCPKCGTELKKEEPIYSK